MGVSSKGKRKLVYSGRTYFWYVQQDSSYFWCMRPNANQIEELFILNISSDDKGFNIAYEVGQSKFTQTPHIVIKGLEFGGLESSYRQGWTRVKTPIWDDFIITPSLIKTIIDWCLLQKDELIIVDFEGNPV